MKASTSILGLSCHYHDAAACLVVDGEIIAAAQEERFSRVKHDPRFPKNAIAYCLSQASLDAANLTHVAYYDKPFLTFERLLTSYLSTAPRGLRSWLQAMPPWLGQKLHVADTVERHLGFRGEVLFTEHHQAHAAAAFYPSPFPDAAILTIDGVGEWATAACGQGSGNTIALLKELVFPDSVGLLYSAFTYFCGFRVNSGEYKLMGLAPYGRPVYKDRILSEVVDLKPDGSIRLNPDCFDFIGGLQMTSRRMDRLFDGPPRRPESGITRREMDIAASIQSVLEEIVLKMAVALHGITGRTDLCLAGGVALNCVANGRLLREGPFERVWVQPAAGDAGGALGAALSVWHHYLGAPRQAQERPGHGYFLGPGYSSDDIRRFLSENGIPFSRLDPGERAGAIAAALADGKIVGHMAGRMEFGPRALGARSILADPRSIDTQFILNQKIKKRESFRPFAPAVLEEDTARYFEFRGASPYMLFVAPVANRYPASPSAGRDLPMLERLRQVRSDIPAVTHLDYSARLQTVTRESQPALHAVLKAFKSLTGCGVLVNTSFNVRGEPIVCTPEDAYRCFMNTDMDLLVMEDIVLRKDAQPPAGIPAPDRAERELPPPSTVRRFGRIAAGIFSIAALASLLLHRTGPALFFAALLAFGGACALRPASMRGAYLLWERTALQVRVALTTLLLTLAFYLVLTPTGWVRRVVMRTGFFPERDAAAPSYWVDRQEPLQPLSRYHRRY